MTEIISNWTRNRRQKLNRAEQFRPLLVDLRWAAHNPNVTGAEPGATMTAKWEGWEFGCRVEDKGQFFRRHIFVANTEQPLHEIPDSEKDPIMAVVMDVMIDDGVLPNLVAAINPFCIKIEQDFVPILLTKKETAKTHISIGDGAMRDVGKEIH